MFDQQLYDKNLQLLAAIDPSLAEKVNALPSTPANGETSSRQQVEQWFSELNLEGISVLYVYGIGSGDAYEVLLPWLKLNPNHYVVFLEDHLAAIHDLLSTPQAAPLLNDIQVDIKDVSKAEIERPIIRLITEENVLRPASITALPHYQEKKASQFTMIRDLIIFESSEQNIQFNELSQLGVIFYRNFYPNILQLPEAYDGQGLFKKFENIPAIICGAGPSLLKDIPLLKQLGNKAIIFAPSSAANILTSHGVWPHFGIAIDPTAETYHRQYMQKGFETPVFYQNRIYNETLSVIQGPKLFLPDPSVYKIESWFEEQFNLSPDFPEGGYSSVHTALLIAQQMGCNPIIFVGVELSKGTEHYSTGVERNPLFPIPTGLKPELGNPIQVKDIRGNEVTSYWQWIAEADWIDKFHRLNPSMTLTNATDAGIGLFSVPNQTLEEATHQYLTREYELDALLHTAIQEAGLLPVTHAQVRDALEIFFQSLKRCLELCNQINRCILSSASKERTKLEKKLKKEIGYQYLLAQMEEFFMKFTQKELRNIKRITNPDDRVKKQQHLDHLIYRFLCQSLDMNLQLIAMALTKEPQAVTEPSSHKQVTEGENQAGSTPMAFAIQGDFTSPTPYTKEKIDKGQNKIKIHYYPSGAIYSIQTFDHELRDGTHLYYYMDGKVRSEINYLKGQLHGSTRLYFPSGKIKREIHFQDGQRVGVEKSWYEGGQRFTELEYQNNTPKHAQCWHINGTLVKDIKL